MLRHVVFSIVLLFASTANAQDESKVNGSIEIVAGKTVGNLETVNGSITIGNGATIKRAKTVNGGIVLANQAIAQSLTAVNGGVEVNTDARIAGDVSTVNGRILLRDRVHVGGNVGNVNGDIRLAAVDIKGQVRTVSGNIFIGVDARVGNGILVEKAKGRTFGKNETPKVVIGPGAVIEGTLEFKRKVNIFVSDRATIGTVKGAKAKIYSGDNP